jgi:hypothetical protein
MSKSLYLCTESVATNMMAADFFCTGKLNERERERERKREKER